MKTEKRQCKVCGHTLSVSNPNNICRHHGVHPEKLKTATERVQDTFTSRPQPLLVEEVHSTTSWL